MVSRKNRRRATTAMLVAVGAALAPLPGSAHADPVVPEHAVVVCDSATLYTNYDSSIPGPVGPRRTLHRGDKIGHTRGAHPVYNGWAATFDFGPNDWGFIRVECIGGYGSW